MLDWTWVLIARYLARAPLLPNVRYDIGQRRHKDSYLQLRVTLGANCETCVNERSVVGAGSPHSNGKFLIRCV
jgi:hypothetical protein